MGIVLSDRSRDLAVILAHDELKECPVVVLCGLNVLLLAKKFRGRIVARVAGRESEVMLHDVLLVQRQFVVGKMSEQPGIIPGLFQIPGMSVTEAFELRVERVNRLGDAGRRVFLFARGAVGRHEIPAQTIRHPLRLLAQNIRVRPATERVESVAAEQGQSFFRPL